MSTQSILVKNFGTYQEEFEKKLFKSANDYVLEKKFMIGEGFNFKNMMFVKSFHKLLCSDNCELMNYVQFKIEGLLDSCETPRTFTQAYHQYTQQVKQCSITDAVNDCCDWAAIEW